MSAIEINRPGYERHLLKRDAVRNALTDNREQSIEILRTRFLDVLYRMDSSQLAERVIRDSDAAEIGELHDSICGEVFDNEEMDEERMRP